MRQAEHFDEIAARYDALRTPPGITILHETLVREGILVGARVLDIGCGTGAMLDVLAREFGCDVAGVDPSAGMLREARAKLAQADLRAGAAERLPFGDRSFDAALMTMVVHLVDRGPAFGEAARVLVPGGRFVIATPDPAAFQRAWMAEVFPSYVELERARFPGPGRLATELRAARFGRVRHVRLDVPRSVSRDDALARLRGRAYSTLALLDEDEVRVGIERAERALPAVVEYVLEWAIVVGER